MTSSWGPLIRESSSNCHYHNRINGRRRAICGVATLMVGRAISGRHWAMAAVSTRMWGRHKYSCKLIRMRRYLSTTRGTYNNTLTQQQNTSPMALTWTGRTISSLITISEGVWISFIGLSIYCDIKNVNKRNWHRGGIYINR